jgi:hypothetical protein
MTPTSVRVLKVARTSRTMTRVVLALALCCIPLTKLLAAPSFQFERIKSFGTPSPGAEPPGPDLSAEGGYP